MSITLNREDRAAGDRGGASPARASHVPRPASQTEVFSINFLRHETLPLSVRRTLVSLAVVYLVIQIGVATALVATALTYGRERHRMQRHLAYQSPTSPSVKSLRREMQAVHAAATEELAQLNAFLAMQRQHFLVGGKLAALTRTLPPRTWITGLSGHRAQRALTIQATYLVDPDDPYALPTKAWLEALQADPVFSQGLTRLELGDSSRKTQGRADLFTFELVGAWE